MNYLRVTPLFVLLTISWCFSMEELKNRGIRPIFDNYKVLFKSPDPKSIYLYDPGITVSPDGRIIACFSLGGPKALEFQPNKGSGVGYVYISDDDGQTWDYRVNFPIWHARPFIAGSKLYILGHRSNLKNDPEIKGNLRIISSSDWGDNWSEVSELTCGQNWHGSATNVWYKDNFVYLVMERETDGEMKGGWKVSELAPVLLRGNINKDLTKRENWTFSSEMIFHETVEDKELDWFGVPFYGGYYPKIQPVSKKRGGFSPIGWLEANVVQITDPKHYWYDPDGRTFHIFMRAHTGITNIGCMIKAVEQSDGTIKTMFQTAPSGKKHFYLPLPGGQMKFCVLYDEETKLYWLLGTQSTDSMTRPEELSADRYLLGDNERRRMVLHFSKNMVDWCFAGVVAIGPSDKSSRHYAQMVINGDDLLILSRSGDLDAKSAHNGNIVTFHRVKNFRNLVY